MKVAYTYLHPTDTQGPTHSEQLRRLMFDEGHEDIQKHVLDVTGYRLATARLHGNEVVSVIPIPDGVPELCGCREPTPHREGRPPEGWRADAGAIVPDPNTFLRVIRTVELRKRGCSLREIAPLIGVTNQSQVHRILKYVEMYWPGCDAHKL